MEPETIPVKAFKSSQMTQILPQIQEMDAMTSSVDGMKLLLKYPPMLWSQRRTAQSQYLRKWYKGEEGGWLCHGWVWDEYLIVILVGMFVPETPA